MSASKGIMRGSEQRDDRYKERTKNSGQVSMPVNVYDSSGNPITSFVSPANTTMAVGVQTVATAGTRVQLTNTSVPCKKVTIQANLANTGAIYVGDSTVSASRGMLLEPTFSFPLTVANLNMIYLDADANN